MENLIEVQLGILLKKFGAGGHKPGSGSAAALQGMLAAQMVRTVIDITKQKPAYKDHYNNLDIYIQEIDDKIYPALSDLIQKDAVQFGKAIDARNVRNAEEDIERKSEYAREALEELKVATDIPIAVAKYCIRLTEMGLYVFDNGFQSARGDSSVAINGALSAVSGCLSIINLNLLSFESNEWTIKMRSEADDIKKTRDLLAEQEDKKQKKLQTEADQMHKFHLELAEYKLGMQLNNRVSNAQIELLVRNIQNAMWVHKDTIWKKDVPNEPVQIIDPEKLLKTLGYQYKEVPTLPTYEVDGSMVQTAGIIDTSKQYVSISRNFPEETTNFTIAHELGHAILHPNLVLHRDRPMDGSGSILYTDFKETQANRFASCFLMPQTLVHQQFKSLFLTDKFEINTQTAIQFGMRISELRAKCKTLRSLSRMLASTEFFNGRNFISLSNQFVVSMETMAIRLEELQLLSI